MPEAPAKGVDTADSPGTNLANRSARAPDFVNRDSVCRTHASGESETLQTKRSATLPYLRPTANHKVSAATEANTAARTVSVPGIRPSRARAPATTRVGTAGIGAPSCSTKTLRATRGTAWSTKKRLGESMVLPRRI